MTSPLEDEFGDILQKARDGKDWSQADLANAVNLPVVEIARMERYEFIPSGEILRQIAEVLDLHPGSLQAIASDQWAPKETEDDPAVDVMCLEVFMGSYPVKCYILRCPQTGESAVVDTGANPETIIRKASDVGTRPSKILLTHNHPDHAGGLGVLDREFACPSWVGEKEPPPSGSRNLKIVQDGQIIKVGSLQVEALSTPGHTAGGFSYKVGETIFSGDAIFAGSMGRANSSWRDLYRSITEVLLTFPEDTRLLPGHGPATTVGEEKRHNPFFYGKVH